MYRDEDNGFSHRTARDERCQMTWLTHGVAPQWCRR